MKHILLVFLLTLSLGITVSCSRPQATIEPVRSETIAVLTSAKKESRQLSHQDQKELRRVMSWLDRDIVELLRHNKFETVLLQDMKEYSSSMGPLFIVNVEYFNPGVTTSLPRGREGNPVSSLDINYKLLDQRGALLTEWQDGVHSIKGGTYCARTLNRRAVAKISEFFESR